ncbi:hypothetical protein JHD48_05380 [Sulfurimonas sp. SAG-AH-194-I05]|nr:hypothetical protein [Sulfurimonas sp. SAG-AH-194-I05]MDF1875159.1 hypothetical protein [Sulfurimonas sp. SAG-AH-194-I05]
MIRIFFTLFFTSQCLFSDVEISGHVDFNAQAYVLTDSSKYKNAFTAKQTLALEYTNENVTLFTKVYAQEAYHDFFGQKDETQRSFVRLDELYVTIENDESTIEIGKSIKFWGSLELRNIVDVFNPNDLRNDMFVNDKLGVWNVSYAYYTENGEIALILKGTEQKQRMAGESYAYYFFSQPLRYDAHLQTTQSKKRPTAYLKWSGSTQSDTPIDYAFIYQNGYDSQRYFSIIANQTLAQHVYRVNKFMTYNTLVIGATLIKLEALYAFVEENTNVGDYSHLGLGVEHTFNTFKSGAGIGLIGEYYRYDTYDTDKFDDVQLFETMQNDLFIGVRYTLNDEDDSSFIGGIVHDLEYDEQTFYVKYESRLQESFKVEIDYFYIEPSKNTQTAYSYLGRHQRVGVNIAYHF